MQVVLFHPDAQAVRQIEEAVKNLDFVTVLCTSYEELHESGLALDGSVVAAGNSFGIMDGGLDEVMRRVHAGDIQALIQGRIAKFYGVELPVGCEVSVFSLDGQHIIYAPTMQIPMEIRWTDNVYRAARAAANRARIDGEELLFVPLLGTGAGGMPLMEALEQILSGVMDGFGEVEPDELTWAHADRMHLKWHRFCGIPDDGFRCAETFGRMKEDAEMANQTNR